ncbi:MAG: inositol monophosphatase family protein [Candidatus Krumholzibacteriia bacterium]
MGLEGREEAQVARDLAVAAGSLLLENLGRLSHVERKSATELVTDLDRQVEERILAGLATAFPGDAIHAEESGDAAGDSGRTWYVDPLDGTTNYVHGHPFFSVSVAVADAGGLLAAVVHAPYLDQLFAAVRGEGAVAERPRNAEVRPLPARRPVRLEDALLATGFPYRRDATVDRNVEYMRRFLRAGCHGVRRGGSAALDLAHTAAGVLDGFWEMRLRPWDVAAGTLLARETGCRVTDLSGRESMLQWDEILAAPPALHERMCAVLNAAP